MEECNQLNLCKSILWITCDTTSFHRFLLHGSRDHVKTGGPSKTHKVPAG